MHFSEKVHSKQNCYTCGDISERPVHSGMKFSVCRHETRKIKVQDVFQFRNNRTLT